ncbi:NPCBM/NEW2 domain-containing protein, partial [Streptomyces sp. NPDC006863]|uniref:NPCBM/NEW2 domain-containing protein n=1 Tax=Streptomyces sp. NPDC006863 TaxID=3154779 RepID=UPI0033D8F704
MWPSFTWRSQPSGTTRLKPAGSSTPKIRYYLGGKCTSFTADVGVDDVQTTRGSVRF